MVTTVVSVRATKQVYNATIHTDIASLKESQNFSSNDLGGQVRLYDPDATLPMTPIQMEATLGIQRAEDRPLRKKRRYSIRHSEPSPCPKRFKC